MRRVVALCALLALGGCGGEPTAAGAVTEDSNPLEPPVIDITGTVSAAADTSFLLRQAIDTNVRQASRIGFAECRPLPRTGIDEGVQITVSDPSTGEQLGLAELDAPVVGGTRRQAPIARPCESSFRFYDVADDREFYEFEISGAGTVQFSRSDVDQPFTIDVD